MEKKRWGLLEISRKQNIIPYDFAKDRKFLHEKYNKCVCVCVCVWGGGGGGQFVLGT